MLSWTIEFQTRSLKDLEGLPSDTQLEILKAVDQLVTEPSRGDVKKLKARQGAWRLRVGKWRVFFSRDRERKTISVLRVVRRSDTTY